MPSGAVWRTERIWLPAVLVALFVAQNFLFNEWLSIYPGAFTGRLVPVAFSLGVIAFGPAVMLGRKSRFGYLTAVSSILALLFVSQYLYYSYYGGFLQASALLYADEAGAVAGTIKKLLAPELVFFIIGPFLVAVAAFLSRLSKQDDPVFPRAAKARLSLVMLVIAFSGYAILFNKEKAAAAGSASLFEYSKLYDVNMMVAKTGVVNYFLVDAYNFISKTHTATPADLQAIADWKSSRRQEPSAEKSFGIAKGRNLILIQVESLDNSLIGKKVGDNEITPNLNRLAKEGLYFDNYYAQVGPGNTADAEFTTLNSLYPLSDEVAFVGYANNSYQALPALLKQNGYQTYALHGDVASFWNRANIYPNLGYGEWLSRQDFSVPRPVCFAELCDGDFLEQSLDKMATFKKPFMATVITLSSHTAFPLPPDMQTLKVPDDHRMDEYQWGYLQSIHYADASIGKFIEGLKQKGLYDDSVIVIFGDHGSLTGMEEVLGVNSRLPKSLTKNQVPLMILVPGTKLTTGTDHDPASHLDLYPTLSSLLGIQAPASVLGQDLLATENPVMVRRSSVTGTVQEVLARNTLYQSSSDGIFGNGSCTKPDTSAKLPSEECKASFAEATATTKVSDIVVRDNILGSLSDSEKRIGDADLTVR
ncbi:MAG: LTA synthase family protein [Patescibacteria group bacterium]